MKKRQRKIRMIRAVIQVLFFITMPYLFSEGFSGIKSVFLALGSHEQITWNHFLTVTAVLLLITCFFGRYFCGYACAFGALGDLLYEISSLLYKKIHKTKKAPGYSEKTLCRLQKIKYIVLAGILFSCVLGIYNGFTGWSPWDVFSLLIHGKLPGKSYWLGSLLLALIMIGMCTQERFFCQCLCPFGAVFAMMPILPSAILKRNRENCASGCKLCKKRCPVHLDIDGDTTFSGECISCRACTAICPRNNIHTDFYTENEGEA
jgi:polyferredoxin